jgi:hypothetical protein
MCEKFVGFAEKSAHCNQRPRNKAKAKAFSKTARAAAALCDGSLRRGGERDDERRRGGGVWLLVVILNNSIAKCDCINSRSVASYNRIPALFQQQQPRALFPRRCFPSMRLNIHRKLLGNYKTLDRELIASP